MTSFNYATVVEMFYLRQMLLILILSYILLKSYNFHDLTLKIFLVSFLFNQTQK